MKLISTTILATLFCFLTTSAEAQSSFLVFDEDTYTPDIAVYSEIQKKVMLENFPATISFRVTKQLGHEGYQCFWDLTLVGQKGWELSFDSFQLDGKKSTLMFKTESFVEDSVYKVRVYANDCALLYHLTHKSTFKFQITFIVNDHIISEIFSRKETNHLKDFQWLAKHKLSSYAEQNP